MSLIQEYVIIPKQTLNDLDTEILKLNEKTPLQIFALVSR